MIKWESHQVADLINDGVLVINDGYRAKNSELSSRGLPFARGANINDGFKFEQADRFPVESLARVGNKISQPGDVVFTSKGTVGRFAFVSEETERFIYSPQLCFWRSTNHEVIDPRYLFFWMRGPEFFKQYNMVKGQTDMADYVSLTDQRRMAITLPPLPIQREIAYILGSLDDKIDLNRRMNATLELMARALFKSWFVDFDPVRTKSDGRQPDGMDAETAALFPDSFEDSELGEIPHGWRVGTLSDLTSFVLGGDWGKSEISSDASQAVLCIRGADIPDLQSGGIGRMPTRYLKANSAEKRILRSGDLVIEISGGSPTQSTARVVYIHGRMLERLELPLSCSNFCRIVRTDSEATSVYAYLWLRWLYDAGTLLTYETGTTGIKNFAYTIFSEQHSLVLPPQEVQDQFHQTIITLFERHQINGAQAETLAVIRDVLLPQLMSGEINYDFHR